MHTIGSDLPAAPEIDFFDNPRVQGTVEVRDSQILAIVPSVEEIKAALFSLEDKISPGPDGYTAKFFKSHWNIVGLDFSNVVQFMFLNRCIPKGFNSTFLVLIPKISNYRWPLMILGLFLTVMFLINTCPRF